jgi:hypothetical protein
MWHSRIPAKECDANILFFCVPHCRAHSSVDVLEKQKHIDIWDFIYQLEYTKKQYI